MATRRSHKKSRNGCDQCKRRRIKCDEDRPCRNCTRRGMTCTFDTRSATPDIPSNNDMSVLLPDIRGPGCCRLSSVPASASANSGLGDPLAPRLSTGTWLPHEWTAQDAELMHHYTLHTSKAFAQRPEMQETWQVAVPEIAYAHEFLMHGLLGLAASHLAFLKPGRYTHYLALAGFHMSLGLRTYRRLIVAPSVDNCHALFCFSSLVMVYIYASPMEHSHTHLDNGNGLSSILELLVLCRGTLVLYPFFDNIRQSSLEHLFLREFMDDQIAASNPSSTPLFKNLTPNLEALERLITTTPIIPTSAQPTFLQALSRLKATFVCIETCNAAQPLECGMLYMWPLSIEEEFFAFLQQRHPVALVLLAFYCAQLHAFRQYWFVGGQGGVWLACAEEALDGEYREFLGWPRGVLAGG
ncbi:hypothetical protein BDW74DRAFT_185543 [Aspergillus multicolor]|uniref:Zn(II)2Cys6 transcription factor n=1 Tax=Aspergillus multicolor TaxID=41759 RepID=UPI003CCCE82F